MCQCDLISPHSRRYNIRKLTRNRKLHSTAPFHCNRVCRVQFGLSDWHASGVGRRTAEWAVVQAGLGGEGDRKRSAAVGRGWDEAPVTFRLYRAESIALDSLQVVIAGRYSARPTSSTRVARLGSHARPNASPDRCRQACSTLGSC